jgi:hypothetical protein
MNLIMFLKFMFLTNDQTGVPKQVTWQFTTKKSFIVNKYIEGHFTVFKFLHLKYTFLNTIIN